MIRPLALLVCAAAVLAVPSDVGAGLAVRNVPGLTTAQTLHLLRRHLLQARDEGAQYLLNETLEISGRFSDVALLKLGHSVTGNTAGGEVSTGGSLEIVCNECYVLGRAVAQFSVSNDTFDVTTALGGVVDQFGQVIENITDYATDYGKSVWANLQDGVDLDDFDLPPLDLDLNIDIPELPECRLRLGFDHLEMYVDLRTTLSAGSTYTMRLYTSTGQTGFEITEDLRLGVLFNLDLVLSVDGAVEINHGFHMRFDEGLYMELNLFAEEVANLEHNGARFEFLPVTINTGEVVLQALLRMSVFSGITMRTPSFLSDFEIGGHSIPSAGGGIEAGLYANLAQLTTNITTELEGEDDGCAVGAVEEFEIAFGAAAGATVFLNDRTWGPTPATHTPVFYTTLGRVCAASSAAEVTPSAVLEGRQDGLSTTTTDVVRTYTGVECLSAGLVDCPASLQSVHKYTVTETLSTAVPSGEDVDWARHTEVGAVSTSGFGRSVQKLQAMTGRPVSYVPPPPPPTESAGENSEGGEGGEDGGDGEGGKPNLALIIGLSVGLGVPALLAVLGGVIFCIRRRRAKTALGSSVTYEKVVGGGTPPVPGKGGPFKGPVVEVIPRQDQRYNH